MAVVVAQTAPFSDSQLELDNPERWHKLLPLIRPSVKSVKSTREQSVLVDTSSANNENVRIAAIGSLGNFSSKLLSEKGVSAIIIEKTGNVGLGAGEIGQVLTANGVTLPNGLVVLRVTGGRKMDMHGADTVEVGLREELELDHVLSLLRAMNKELK